MGFFGDVADAIGGFFGGTDTNGDGTADGGGLIDALNGDGSYRGEPVDRNGDGRPDGGGLLDALDGSGTFRGYENGHGGGLVDSINGDGSFMGIKSGNIFSGGWVGLEGVQNIGIAHSFVRDNFTYSGAKVSLKDLNINNLSLDNIAVDQHLDISVSAKIDVALAEMALTEEGFATMAAAVENNNNQNIDIVVADFSALGIVSSMPAIAMDFSQVSEDDPGIVSLQEAGLLAEDFSLGSQNFGIVVDIEAMQRTALGLENGTFGSLSLERALAHELTHIAEDHMSQVRDGSLTVAEMEYETVAIVNDYMAAYYGEERRGDYFSSQMNDEGTSLAELSIDTGAITGSEIAGQLGNSSNSGSHDGGDNALSRNDILQSSNPIKTILTNVVRRDYNDILGREADPEGLDAHVNSLLSGEQTIEQVRENIRYSEEGVENAIQNIYNDVLGREADAEGAEFWTGKINSKEMTIEEVRNSIQLSDEGVSTFIDKTYENTLGRAADDAGKEFYTEKVNSGEIKLFDVLDNVSNSVEATEVKIEKIYEDVLERATDDAGKEYYVEKVVSGEMSVDEVTENISNSEEATNVRVEKIYNNILQREADDAGKEYYVEKVQSGEMTLSDVVENIASSQESRGLQIEAIYNDVFDRPADTAGKEFYLDKIESGEMTIVDVATTVVNSEEAVGNSVKNIYDAVLDREADDEGLAYYVDKVVSGEMSVDDVRENIASSPEALDLIAAAEAAAVEELAAAEALAAQEAQALQEAADLAARTQAETDIRAVYEDVLGREADAEGLEYYVDKVMSGEMSVNSVRENVLSSAESQALETQQSIDDIYQSTLGRPADLIGRDFYAQKVISGEMSIADVRENIANSPEARANAAAEQAAADEAAAIQAAEIAAQEAAAAQAAQEAAQEAAAIKAAQDAKIAQELEDQVEKDIDNIYETVLDRSSDTAGLDYYTQKVISGEMSIADVRENIANSPEARANAAAEQAAADEAAAIQAAEIAAQEAAAAQAAQEAAQEAAAIKAAQDAKIAQELEDQVEKNIDNIYETVLDRSSDTAGLNYYTQKVISGEMSIADVRENIANSPEARANAAAEQAAAQRAADAAAEATAQRAADAAAEAAAQRAADAAAEAAAQRAADAAAEAAAQRAADAAAEAAAQRAADAAAEAAAQRAANDPLENLYNTVLGRESDGAGKDFWQGQIDNGMSIDEVKTHFENSPEYKEKTPLVLDLDGDGIELTQVWNGVAFDIDNDGVNEQTAWAAADDALLAYDENGDGIINDQSELFGDTETLTDGFNKLASYDSNQDGVIDSGDEIFEDLVAWQDVNQDGVSDSDEMLSLESLNIVSINLNAEMPEDMYIEGNWISHVSDYTKTDGSSYEISDVWFQYQDDDMQANTGDIMFTQGQGEDTVITDFNSDEGDILDISGYLSGYDEVQGAIDNFVFTTTENIEDVLLKDTDNQTVENNAAEREIFSHGAELQDSIIIDDNAGVI